MGKNTAAIMCSLLRSSLVAILVTTFLLILSGCSGLDSPRNFSAEDLLLSQDVVPSGWERTQVEPVSIARFGFGNEDLDRWVGFVDPNDPQNQVFANHFVFVFQDSNRATSWYEDKLPIWFNDNSVGVNKPWGSYPDLTYEPSAATQYKIACTEGNVAGQRLVCLFAARYEEFVILFSSVIDVHTTSIAGFNELVEHIDGIMTEHLQPD